jgi:hypothetical protein
LSDKQISVLFSRSVDGNDLPVVDDDLPASSLFFSISGSTYRRRIFPSSNATSDRFRVCVTVPVLEKLHEVNNFFFLIQ